MNASGAYPFLNSNELHDRYMHWVRIIHKKLAHIHSQFHESALWAQNSIGLFDLHLWHLLFLGLNGPLSRGGATNLY